MKFIYQFFISLAALVCAGAGFSFPENIRHGYPSCSSCHIAPSGGGITTAYGRSQAAAFMSSFAVPKEENPDYGLLLEKLPPWLNLGGDMRYLNLNMAGPQGFKASRKFMMQADVEVAFWPVKPVVFVMSGGLYGEKPKKEYRRNYLKLQLSDNFSLRAGRFFPAYGLMLSDHRLATRAGLGFGQGEESYNLESSFISEYGEAFITGVFGNRADLRLSESQGYTAASRNLVGAMGRAAFFAGDKVQLGLSGMRLSSVKSYRRALGVFILGAFNDRIYGMAEYDLKEEDEVRTNIAFGKLGAEVLRGFHLGLLGELNDRDTAAGGQVQWFPRPHWELLGEYKRSFSERGYLDTALFIIHYYL